MLHDDGLATVSVRPWHDLRVHIELIGHDCPVLTGVTVGVQSGTDVVDEHAADGTADHWLLDVRLVDGPDLRGPSVHGKPGARFIYPSWVHATEGMFRRAKLMLDGVPHHLLVPDGPGLLGRAGLTMPDGSPLCAAVRPPQIDWSAR